jgi:hypothetical protein
VLRRIVSSFLLNLLNIFFLFFSRFCVVRQQPERPASDPGDERISDRDQAVKSSAEALQRRFQALLRPQPTLQPEWSPPPSSSSAPHIRLSRLFLQETKKVRKLPEVAVLDFFAWSFTSVEVLSRNFFSFGNCQKKGTNQNQHKNFPQS